MEHTDITKVCNIEIGKTPSRNQNKYWGSGEKWVSISDMKEKYIFNTKEEITDIAIKETNIKIVPLNTVIMSFKLSVGKVAITKCDLYTNEAIAAFHILDANILNHNFLYYALQTLKLTDNTDRAVMGLTLNKSKLKQLKIPLPPLEIQKKIVEVLDKAQELIDLRKKQISFLDDLIQSFFYDMFGNPVTNPKRLELKKLKHFGEWKSGGTPSRKLKQHYEGNIPWVSSGELNSLFIHDSVEHITHEALINSAAKIILEDSIMLGMYDTAALKSSINSVKMTCNQAIAFSKLDSKKSNTLYVYWCIQIGKEYYRRMQRGVRQKNMNLSMIKNIEIMNPPIELQNQFAEKVQKIEAQKEIMQESLAEMENNFNNLMQRAFKGELFGE